MMIESMKQKMRARGEKVGHSSTFSISEQQNAETQLQNSVLRYKQTRANKDYVGHRDISLNDYVWHTSSKAHTPAAPFKPTTAFSTSPATSSPNPLVTTGINVSKIIQSMDAASLVAAEAAADKAFGRNATNAPTVQHNSTSHKRPRGMYQPLPRQDASMHHEKAVVRNLSNSLYTASES